jgi:glucose repression regulatory protein TUP1
METGACKTLVILEPESIDAGVTSVAISPDSRWVATGSLDMLVRIWDVNTGALVERLRGHKDSVYSVVFSPDGRGLVSGSLDKSLKYWDITPMIRAVAAGGSSRVQLRQDGIVASNQGPMPGGKMDGGGEMGSTCTVAFAGHKVRNTMLYILCDCDSPCVSSNMCTWCLHNGRAPFFVFAELCVFCCCIT